MQYFLIELDVRPDGVVNQSINHYSTKAITMSMYYQQCAKAVASTNFVSVFLMVIDQNGNPYAQNNIVTQYVPPATEEVAEESMS